MNPSKMDQLDFSGIVLYEDNHILVVLKPAGILTQGDSSGRMNLLDMAKDYLKVKYNKPGNVFLGLVHRLDRQTAGVIVFARTSKAAGRLSDQFRKHAAEKIYWAVVEGAPEKDSGLREDYLARNGSKTVKVESGRPDAQLASLSYKTLKKGDKTSLLEVNLHTGRKHQIRAQLAESGTPIAGDVKYGSRTPPKNDSIGLAAKTLRFTHPTTGEKLTFDKLPDDWPWLPLVQPGS